MPVTICALMCDPSVSQRPLPSVTAAHSEPYVCFYTEKIEPRPTDRVLENGTGSGYRAVLRTDSEVYTIEIITTCHRARPCQRLATQCLHAAGDGYKGWPEAAPFDAIVVTAAGKCAEP